MREIAEQTYFLHGFQKHFGQLLGHDTKRPFSTVCVMEPNPEIFIIPKSQKT